MFEFLRKLTSSVQSPRNESALGKSSRGKSARGKSAREDVLFWIDLPAISLSSVGKRVASADSETLPVASSKSGAVALPNSRRPATYSASPYGAPSNSNTATGLVASHRERLLAMKLEYLKLCPPKRCGQLAELGIQTAGDLVFSDPKQIAAKFPTPQRAERALQRYRAAIRMALAVESMMPRDALLLVSIHRRSVKSLARESAAQLHRDLERFSLSTRGSKLVGRRGIPSLRRVKIWVATCRQLAESATAASASSPQTAAA